MGLRKDKVGLARTAQAVEQDYYCLGRFVARELSVDDREADLSEIIEEGTVSREPVIIRGRERNAVVVCEVDGIAANEKQNMLSVPGTRESLAECNGGRYR